MQSAAAFSATPTLPLLKPRKFATAAKPSFKPILCSNDSQNLTNASLSLPLRRSWNFTSSSSSVFRPWTALPVADPDSKSRFVTQATAVPESADGDDSKSSVAKTLELGLLFGLWYLFNIYFNIYNKQVLVSVSCFLSLNLVIVW